MIPMRTTSLELGCWTATAMLPILAWINGPAVSPDQCVIRWAAAMVVVWTAIGLRLAAWRNRKCTDND